MKNPILRIAQEAPPGGAPPPPAPGGDMGAPPPMDMGMPPMDSMMGGMGGPPGGGPPPGASAQPELPILTPLDSAGAILKDYGIDNSLKTLLSNSPREGSTGEEEIANLIWRNYGGDKLGGVVPGRVGKRSYDEPPTEPEKLNIVENSDGLRPVQNRWIRLPEGQSLLDLDITLENIKEAVSAISVSNSLSEAAKAKAGGGGPTASISLKNRVILANKLDQLGLYEYADKMFPN